MSKREKICCIYMIKNKLNKIKLKMLSKRSIRNKKYMELLDYFNDLKGTCKEDDDHYYYVENAGVIIF